jgi:hypothetical protein
MAAAARPACAAGEASETQTSLPLPAFPLPCPVLPHALPFPCPARCCLPPALPCPAALQKLCDGRGFKTVRIDGGTDVSKRQDVVNAFNSYGVGQVGELGA